MLRSGWRTSVLGFILLGFAVLVVNVGFLAYGSSRGNVFGVDSVVLIEGTSNAECDYIQRTNTCLHLLINMLSTALLAGSNYTMQCLSAPTRMIVDRRHAQGRWLDIGVSSFRNLRSIPPLRLALWCLLCLSSVPLHLLYNSVIFTSTSLNNYIVLSVTKSFVEPDTSAEEYHVFDITNVMIYGDHDRVMATYNSTYQQYYGNISASDLALGLQSDAVNGQLVNLTVSECIRAYTSPFQSLYRHVLLVSDADDARPPSLNHSTTTTPIYTFAAAYDYCIRDPGSWWPCSNNGTDVIESLDTETSNCGYGCRSPIDPNRFQGNNNAIWTPLGPKVHYCLAQPTEPLCALRLQPTIAVVVVALNVVKVLAMMLTLRIAFGVELPLLTIGDAIASFLSEADTHTKGICLAGRADFSSRSKKNTFVSAPRRLVQGEKRWLHSTSVRKWTINILIYLAGIGAIAGYLGRGLQYMGSPKDLPSLWNLGFGTVSGRTMIKTLPSYDVSPRDVIGYILLANISQLIFSTIYFSYNTIFTSMLAAKEWDLFATRRRGLRVSSSFPVGEQNSNYFLQLPLKFGIPLIVCSVIFHWLLSQSIFLVNIMIRNFDGDVAQPHSGIEDLPSHLVTCGYSPIAIVFALILACLLVVAILYMARIPFKTVIPVVGSCSAAIAAACHATDGNNDPTRKLQWGAVIYSNSLKTPPNESSSLITDRDGSMADDLVSSRVTGTFKSGYHNSNAEGDVELRLMGVRTAEVMPDYEDSERVGHCSFTNGPVEPAIAGRYYA